jgi:hypothetical protein
MSNMAVTSFQLDSYTPKSHPVQKFPSGDNWYKENVNSLESGKGWRKLVIGVDLSTTLNLAELQKSADGPPGWTSLAIKQGGKVTVVNKNAAGTLEIANGPDGYEPMNEAAHIPGIRSSLVSSHATAWLRETAAGGDRSVADLNKEIASLRADHDVINSDLQTLEKAKSSKKFLGTQTGLLNSMRKDLEIRIERLEGLRNAAKAREAQAAWQSAPDTRATEPPVAGTPPQTPAVAEPDIFVQPVDHGPAMPVNHEKAIGAWLDKASDLVIAYQSKDEQAKLKMPEGREAYQNARSELDEAYARDIPESLVQEVMVKLANEESGAPSGAAPTTSSKLGSDLAYMQLELEKIDAIAKPGLNTGKPAVKRDDAVAKPSGNNDGPTVDEICAASDPDVDESTSPVKKNDAIAKAALNEGKLTAKAEAPWSEASYSWWS